MNGLAVLELPYFFSRGYKK